LFLELICKSEGSFKLWFNEYCIAEMEHVNGRFLYLINPFLCANVNWTFLEFKPSNLNPNYVAIRILDEFDSEYTFFDFNSCFRTCLGNFDTKDFPENAIDTGFFLPEVLKDNLKDPVWIFGEPLEYNQLSKFSEDLWNLFYLKDLTKIWDLVSINSYYSEQFKDYISSFLEDSYFIFRPEDFNNLNFRNIWNHRLYEICDELGRPFLRWGTSKGESQEGIPVYVASTGNGLKWVL